MIGKNNVLNGSQSLQNIFIAFLPQKPNKKTRCLYQWYGEKSEINILKCHEQDENYFFYRGQIVDMNRILPP